MANRRSSIKKIRVDKRRHEHNQRVRTELKTVTRRLKELISGKKAAEAGQAIREVYSKLDKAVKKKVIHANRASRLKSRLQARIRSLQAVKTSK